jgi:O-antigen ligase
MSSTNHDYIGVLRPPANKIKPLLLAALGGVALGGVVIIAAQASGKWMMVTVLAVATLVIAMLVKDVRKLVLVAIAADIPLGLDIAIQDQAGHQGGPTGYIVSLVTVALVVGYAIWIVEREPKLHFFAGVTVPALLFLFMNVVSLFQSVNLQLSLFGLFLNCQLFLMYFYLANHMRSWQDVRLVLTAVAIGLLLEAAIMCLQYFTGASLTIGAIGTHAWESATSPGFAGPRVAGTIGTPNSAAAYLVFALLLAFSAHLGGMVKHQLALLACLLGIVALFATGSRSAWGSLVLAVLVLLSLGIRTKTGKNALLIILVGALLVGGLFGQQIWTRIKTATTDHTRSELAFMAYNIIRAFPLGVGENNYDQVMSDKYAHPNWVGHHLLPVHNKYLLVWAETGIQGLAAFVLLLLATAWQARQWLFRPNLPSHLLFPLAGVLAAFLGYAFHMMTEGFASRANTEILWFLMAMMVAMNQLVFHSVQETEEQDALAPARLDS